MNPSSVIDSSAAIDLIREDRFDEFASRDLYAPHLIDLEIANVFRKLVLRKRIDVGAAQHIVQDWAVNDVVRLDHGSMLGRVWQLRDTITPYDASYVALAEHLQVPLVTADKRLAAAAGYFCEVELLG